jgi:signal transduction histidine kinase
VRLRAQRDDGLIRVVVTDDGVGGADPARGSGLIGLSDRIGAIGGRLAIDSPPGAGVDRRRAACGGDCPRLGTTEPAE